MSENKKLNGDEPGQPKQVKDPKPVTQTGATTAMRRKMMRELPKVGFNVSEAGRRAGYSTPAAAHAAMKSMRPQLIALLDAHGLGDESLIEKYIKPGLEATKMFRTQSEGMIMEERTDVDYAERRGMLDVVLRLRGSYAPVKVDAHVETEHTFVVELEDATDEQLKRILRVGALAGRKSLSDSKS